MIDILITTFDTIVVCDLQLTLFKRWIYERMKEGNCVSKEHKLRALPCFRVREQVKRNPKTETKNGNQKRKRFSIAKDYPCFAVLSYSRERLGWNGNGTKIENMFSIAKRFSFSSHGTTQNRNVETEIQISESSESNIMSHCKSTEVGSTVREHATVPECRASSVEFEVRHPCRSCLLFACLAIINSYLSLSLCIGLVLSYSSLIAFMLLALFSWCDCCIVCKKSSFT